MRAKYEGALRTAREDARSSERGWMERLRASEEAAAAALAAVREEAAAAARAASVERAAAAEEHRAALAAAAAAAEARVAAVSEESRGANRASREEVRDGGAQRGPWAGRGGSVGGGAHMSLGRWAVALEMPVGAEGAIGSDALGAPGASGSGVSGASGAIGSVASRGLFGVRTARIQAHTSAHPATLPTSHPRSHAPPPPRASRASPWRRSTRARCVR